MASDFSLNLRFLCAEAGSIAQACRGIGINRQQFNRYLNGGGMPSAHNLRRIARHFALREEELFVPHAEFRARSSAGDRPAPGAALEQFGSLFTDQARHLRRYLGFYHGYFRTPTWPGRIIRTLIRLRAQDGYVLTHTFERATVPDGSILQRATYTGMAALRGSRICMYESPRRGSGFLSETVVMPEHPQQVSYLQGLSLGVAARPDLQPFATRTVWVRISSRTTAREALAATGAYPQDSLRIDPKVRQLLGTDLPLSINTAPSSD